MSEERTKYGKLIGRIEDQYYFLDEIFKHSDNFQGATATVLRPVPKDEWEERSEPDNLREDNREAWQAAVERGETDLGLDDWMEYADISEPYYDDSGSQYHDQLRALGLSEEDYPVIECTGGGRSFTKEGAQDQEFEEVYNPELLTEIQKVEK
jgi:hypothetical protein